MGVQECICMFADMCVCVGIGSYFWHRRVCCAVVSGHMGNVNHRYCGWWVLMPIARAEQGATVRLSGRSCPSVPLLSFLVGFWFGWGLAWARAWLGLGFVPTTSSSRLQGMMYIHILSSF